MLTVGLDIGSTTVKAAVAEGAKVVWQDYKRHNTKQAEMVLEFLQRMQAECGLTPGRDRIFVTGSGAGSTTFAAARRRFGAAAGCFCLRLSRSQRARINDTCSSLSGVK